MRNKIKILMPRAKKGFVNVSEIRGLNPNLQIVNIRKKFSLTGR